MSDMNVRISSLRNSFVQWLTGSRRALSHYHGVLMLFNSAAKLIDVVYLADEQSKAIDWPKSLLTVNSEWNQSVIGVNAIGICAETEAMSQVTADEHSKEQLKLFQTIAVPIPKPGNQWEAY